MRPAKIMEKKPRRAEAAPAILPWSFRAREKEKAPMLPMEVAAINRLMATRIKGASSLIASRKRREPRPNCQRANWSMCLLDTTLEARPPKLEAITIPRELIPKT